jgi:hypothetical protein
MHVVTLRSRGRETEILQGDALRKQESNYLNLKENYHGRNILLCRKVQPSHQNNLKEL